MSSIEKYYNYVAKDILKVTSLFIETYEVGRWDDASFNKYWKERVHYVINPIELTIEESELKEPYHKFNFDKTWFFANFKRYVEHKYGAKYSDVMGIIRTWGELAKKNKESLPIKTNSI